jgi:CRISPR-associated protein (TIGR02584 family)
LSSSILIATLGSKPQLITLALDCLHVLGKFPDDLVVVHASRGRKETSEAIKKLQLDFPANYPHLNARFEELMGDDGKPLADITSKEEVEAAFRSIYAIVSDAKLNEKQVHLLIAGGRRTLTVAGMSTAQILFDDEDRLWHLASHPELEASGSLHADGDEWSRLIPIPFIPWGRLSPVFDVLRSVKDPFEAVQKLGTLRLRDQWDSARIFVLTKLTAAEKNVVELLVRDGLSQNDIAANLTLSIRTVEEHMRSAYRKAKEYWELESDVRQPQLIRLLSIFFVNEPRR